MTENQINTADYTISKYELLYLTIYCKTGF